ncbi:Hypothetical Protein FCC1311_043182 [Hondaea fermentalgiana]|uniref:EF-hand domain-containing protein n=1 Tax=Hondaea fermentalgiana TaxID=2315210 RepID=A0A2R5GC13_9STRA|nr:Hypothetical Protein FCC1311_043182 [Hondaea fermentalgiana]|eukprot:GBG28095.1 Hypothetical Protein FCC1311_043182 [Hondaea fermentalgiana]
MPHRVDSDLAVLDAVEKQGNMSAQDYVDDIKTGLSRESTMGGAFERLQYPNRKSVARPVRKKEIFENLAKNFGILIPHDKRSAVFARLDHNHDGQIDFRHDFAILYEGKGPRAAPASGTLAAREAYSIECLCRAFQEKGESPRDIWKGQASLSFAETIRRLEGVAPELSNQDMYPIFHRMGLDARAEGLLGADDFCAYFEPKLNDFLQKPAAPTRPQSAKSARSTSGVAARNRKRVALGSPRRDFRTVSRGSPVALSHAAESPSVLLGRIDDMCTFVVILDLSPGMAETKMTSGEARIAFAARETISYLRRKAEAACTNKVNLVVFGDGVKAAKWRDRCERLSTSAVDDIEDFLHRQVDDWRAFSFLHQQHEQLQNTHDLPDDITRTPVQKSQAPRVLRTIFMDMLNNDAVSEVCVICALDARGPSGHPAPCALQDFKGRALVKLVRGRQTGCHKLPTSPGPRFRSCVVPKTGGSVIVVNVAVVGPVADNAHTALSRLARAGNGTVRWVNDAGEEMCHITQMPRHGVASDSRDGGAAGALQGFWWALQKSPTADATKRVLKRVIVAILKTSLPLDEAYAAFDANGDGTVSVGDFSKVVNAILVEEAQGCANKLSTRERFRLWRVFDTVDLGFVSIPRFVAVVRVAASYLGLDVDPLLANSSLHAPVEEQMGIIHDALAQGVNNPGLRPHTASSKLRSHSPHIQRDNGAKKTALALHDDAIGHERNESGEETKEEEEEEGEEEVNEGEDEEDDDYEDDDMQWLPSETESSHASASVPALASASASASASETAPSALLSVSTPYTEARMDVVDPMSWAIPAKSWRLPCLESRILRLQQSIAASPNSVSASNTSEVGAGCKPVEWSIRNQAKVATDTIAVTLAVNAAWERIRLGVADTPGLLHGRTTAYRSESLPEDLRLAPELLHSQRWAQHMCNQAPFGDAMDSFATFHPLDMNEWLQREDRSICSSGELSLAPPLLHAQSHLNGSSFCEERPNLRPSDQRRLHASLLSVHGRQLTRAQDLVGLHVADEHGMVHRVSKILTLPPRPAGDALVRLGLEMDGGKVVDAGAAIKESSNFRLIVPEDSVGASDGERYVPPGVDLPLGRYWGPLQCYSVGTLHGGFGLPSSAISAVTLELPAFVPFTHELDLASGVVDVGPEGYRREVDLASETIRNLPVKRFRGLCIRAGRVGPSADLLTLYKLDRSLATSRNSAANKIMSMGSIIARIRGPDSLQSLWVTEVPPSWLHSSELLATCRVLWNTCRQQGAHRTASGRVELTLPQLDVHSGFVPVDGLPGTRQSTSFTLDVAGCELSSCCGIACALARPSQDGSDQDPDAVPIQALDPLVQERETSEMMLADDRFVFSKPLLCFMTNGQELLSAFIAGQDGWALAKSGPANLGKGNDVQGPRLSVRTSLRLRSHHNKLRSPTKDLPDPGSPNMTGLKRTHGGPGPTLYRIPDGATTEECMIIIAQTIAETIQATHTATSLGQFFDALAEVCSTGAPDGRNGAPKALNRKALTTGLRRTLGIKMNWSQFDAVFLLLGAGSTEVSKDRFVKAFTRRIMRITDSVLDADAAATGDALVTKAEPEALESLASLQAVTRSDRQWLRETLGGLVDALEGQGHSPATLFPNGASAAEFVRYLSNLDTQLSKQDLYKLLSAVDTGFVRKLDSWLDFGNMLSAVYMERLRDLQVLRAARSGTMRTRAIDYHVARIERMLRHQETSLHEARMFKHSIPMHVLEAIGNADRLCKRLMGLCAKYAHESDLVRSGNAKQVLAGNAVTLETLQTLQDEARRAEQTAERALSDFEAKVNRAPQVSEEAARIARNDLVSPWLHVAFRNGTAIKKAAHGPFATLLRRAGIAVSTDRGPHEEDREFRLQRLRSMVAKTEVRLAREDAAQRRAEASNATSSLNFADRNAARLVRIQWQPHGPTRPLSAKASPARSLLAEPTLKDGMRQLTDSMQQPQTKVHRTPKHITVDARQISFGSVRDLMMDSESDPESESGMDPSLETKFRGATTDNSKTGSSHLGAESTWTLTSSGGNGGGGDDDIVKQATEITGPPPAYKPTTTEASNKSVDDQAEGNPSEDGYEDEEYSEAEFEDEEA